MVILVPSSVGDENKRRTGFFSVILARFCSTVIWTGASRQSHKKSSWIHKAKEIAELLAHGVDPSTGEVFPAESHYNNPEVIRALFTMLASGRTPIKATKKSIEDKQKENIDNGKPKNAGLPWNTEQRQEVAKHFEKTQGEINSEFTHQGLIK